MCSCVSAADFQIPLSAADNLTLVYCAMYLPLCFCQGVSAAGDMFLSGKRISVNRSILDCLRVLRPEIQGGEIPEYTGPMHCHSVAPVNP